MKRILPLILIALLMFPTTGCNQNQAAALVGIAGTAIASLETIEGNTDAAAQIQKDFSAAQAAVLNWKAGTPTQDVAQALALVQNDLNLLPVSDKDAAYITLAIGTVQSILDLFPAQSQPSFAVTAKSRTVTLAVTPHTANDFKSQWNALLSANSVPGLAPLK